MRTVQLCEIDPYCQDILKRHFPGVPIHGDIKTLEVPTVDVVCGGPPCQPVSLAGARGGESDSRWLWAEFLECCRRARAAWVVAENPIGILSMRPRGIEWIIGEMEAMGYEVQCFRMAASDVGAPHRRARVFLVAYAGRFRYKTARAGDTGKKTPSWESHGSVLDRRGWRLPTPGFLGLANGVPNWVDRTSAIGNSIVPRIAYIIGKGIIDVMNA